MIAKNKVKMLVKNGDVVLIENFRVLNTLSNGQMCTTYPLIKTFVSTCKLVNNQPCFYEEHIKYDKQFKLAFASGTNDMRTFVCRDIVMPSHINVLVPRAV